jgi:hypothetical protein
MQLFNKRPMIVAGVLVIAATVVAAVLPGLFVSHRISPINACLNNQRRIDAATCHWAADNHKTTNDIPTWEEIRPYLLRYGKMPACPLRGTYALGRSDKPPTCSYPGHTLPQ